MTKTALLILWFMQAMCSQTKETREARLWPLAFEVAIQATSPQEAAFALAQGWGESRFDRDVMWLNCRPGMCDPISGTKLHRARGPWQPHDAKDDPEWSELWHSIRGQASVAEMVRLQLKTQRIYLDMCDGNTLEAFGAHGGGGCEPTERSAQREARRRHILSRLRGVWGK